MSNKFYRKPTVENKYNLTPAMIRKFIVHREFLKEPMFWRNNVISAWCLSITTQDMHEKYSEYSPYDNFWLGVYDEDAPSYAGKIRFYFTSYGEMCGYKFKEFYDFSDIENEHDLKIQEKCLSILNNLIDRQIFQIPSETLKLTENDNHKSIS